ncbi:MAG: iron-sulfur cluster assembly scaffold protein [Candidatus Beckwithbacteria bacterium]|nr:iron-sulfur cluster assembly scaffold protein [Patescibacteria group bacterium]
MNIYKEEISDHFKSPRNFGLKEDKDWVVAEERNSSCGDVIKLGVKINKFEVTQPMGGQANLKFIEEVGFEGEGCAICMASASMLTEMIKGKSLKEAGNIGEEEMMERLGIKISAGRKKCATLGLVAWQKLQKMYE